MASGFGLVLESQVRALDTAIQSLDQQITASKAPLVNEPFKKSWRSFTVRWQIQRDAWLQAGDITRKFGFSEAVYESFKTAFQKWLADFQRRVSGSAKAPSPAVPPAPPRPLFGNVFAGTGTTLVIAGLILGGYLWYQQSQKRT